MIDIRQILTARTPTVGQRLVRMGLRLLSPIYGAAIKLRNVAFDRGWLTTHLSTLPVISVGNLSVGGTGKSPVVAWLARWLRQRDLRVAILSRGYRALDSGENDEALELELQFPDVPHLQNSDRVAAAQLAADELEMEALVLDDGMQHRHLARNLDLVLIDASEPPAARRLLPGGLLREPFSSLKRASAVILTRCDQARPEELQQLKRRILHTNSSLPILEGVHRPQALLQYPNDQQTLDYLRGKRILAFCGIGNPGSFFQSLVDLGAESLDGRTWPDHHAYSAEDIDEIAQWAREHSEAECLICTRKDWVKIQEAELGGLPLYALAIEFGFTSGEQQLHELLEETLQIASNSSTLEE